MTTLPLATSTWDEREHEALAAVIRSGRFTMGERVAAFEREFAAFFGARHAVMVNSGSSANLLAVAALTFTSPPRLQPGATVLVPAVSWPTTYYPLSQYGLRLKFVDIDRDTLNYDLDALDAAATPDVGAIMCVNLLGNPNDFARVRAIADRCGAVLVEDNCESMGARFEGAFTGTFGQVGTFSTFFSHHISTMEGGVCVTGDDELYHILLSLRAHGWTRNLPWPNTLAQRDERGPFYELFRFVLPGYNVRPLEMSGALGTEQLRKLPALLAGRRDNAAFFLEQFADLPEVRVQREIGESSWFGFALTLEHDAAGKRDQVVDLLQANGIETRPVVAGNFFRNPVMQHLPHVPAPALPVADQVDADAFYVGNHHYDVRDGLRRLRHLVGEALCSPTPRTA